jgi:hypothetical protein
MIKTVAGKCLLGRPYSEGQERRCKVTGNKVHGSRADGRGGLCAQPQNLFSISTRDTDGFITPQQLLKLDKPFLDGIH